MQNPTIKREILIPRGMLAQLIQHFNTSHNNVKKALSGVVITTLHADIREYALRRGARYADEVR